MRWGISCNDMCARTRVRACIYIARVYECSTHIIRVITRNTSRIYAICICARTHIRKFDARTNLRTCVCVFMPFTYACLCVCVHMCVLTYVCVRVRVSMDVRARVRVHVHVHLHVRVCVSVCMLRACARAGEWICVHVYMCMHKCVGVYLCTCVYVYFSLQVWIW